MAADFGDPEQRTGDEEPATLLLNYDRAHPGPGNLPGTLLRDVDETSHRLRTAPGSVVELGSQALFREPDASGSPSREGMTFGLYPLRAVNVLVGPNNAGKSRLMRAMLAAEELRCDRTIRRPQDSRLAPVFEFVEELRGLDLRAPGTFQTFLSRQAVLRFVHAHAGSGAERDPTLAERRGRVASDTRVLVDALVRECADGEAVRGLPAALKGRLERVVAQLRAHQGGAAPEYGRTSRLYVPSTRTLRLLKEDEPQRYLEERHLSSDATGSARFTIWAGNTLYESLRGLALGGRDGRERLSAFEDFVSRTCFSGVTTSISPNESKSAVEVTVGGDAPRTVDEIGDGVAQVILLTFPLFSDPERAFFIDEPELHLHPGFQRAVVDVYLKEAKGPVFMATHSNHIIDRATGGDDIGLLRVWRADKTGKPVALGGGDLRVDVVDRGDMRVLDDLGVTVSSVMRVNCVIWVEGPSDVIIIDKLLDLAAGHVTGDRALVRDLHYGYAMYGGSNIASHAFAHDEEGDEDTDCLIKAARVGGAAVVIADSDGGKKTKRDDRLRGELRDRFLPTECYEVEWLVPEPVWTALFTGKGRAKPDAAARTTSAFFANAEWPGGKVAFARAAVQHAAFTWEALPPDGVRLACELRRIVLESNPLASTDPSPMRSNPEAT